MQDEVIGEIEEMFVQLARQVRGTSDSLTLEGVAPSTLFFSDRPARVVGHMGNKQFVKEWSEGEDSFEHNPPNAVLSFADPEGQLEDAVVVLTKPSLEGDSIRYGARVLEGDIPQKAGACTLFIDPLGRPLSPVSVAGVHRRERRRMRRGI